MKILYITPIDPSPPRRGYTLMAFHQIRMLSERHQIDLVCFDSSDGPDPERALGRYCRRVVRVPFHRLSAIARAARAVSTPAPLQVSYYSSGSMKTQVERLLKEEQHDIVVVYLTRMAQYLPAWYRGTGILNMVDPYALSYQRSLSWRPACSRFAVRAESERLVNYERAAGDRFAKMLLISGSDVRDYSQLLGRDNLDWAPHAVDADQFSPPGPDNREEGSIVMTGSMFYSPNVDAVNFFCSDIFPRICRRVPSAKLSLVGSRPARSVRRWARLGNVEVTGFVPDVQPYLHRAMVSVCPVRLAIGTQTKLLEAMAAGTPVVTTSAGNHGINGRDGEDLAVADDAESFADRVCELLERQGWERLARNGRRLILERFTWRKHVERFEQILIESHSQHNGTCVLARR